jgi:penicillin-binding protein 1A
MAQAFSVFANQGREVSPIAIRSIEDRNGRVVIDTERDLRMEQRRKGAAIQIVSPQNAYIMTSIMKKTVEYGTLAHGAGWGSKFTFKDAAGKNFRMPAAGKTGTTQNWSDAWAVGYTPYYTTAIWFGFDKPGNSLGVSLTGATLCGPLWGDYMREIHRGLPYRDFSRPNSGLIDVTVCAKSGLLRIPACNEGEVTMPFLDGTQPTQYCNLHGDASYSETAIGTMRTGTLGLDEDVLLGSLTMPTLDPELFPEQRENAPGNSRNTNRGNSNQGNRNAAQSSRSTFRNPFLDGDFNQSSGRGSNPALSSDERPEQSNPFEEMPDTFPEDFSLPSLNSDEDYNFLLD